MSVVGQSIGLLPVQQPQAVEVKIDDADVSMVTLQGSPPDDGSGISEGDSSSVHKVIMLLCILLCVV